MFWRLSLLLLCPCAAFAQSESIRAIQILNGRISTRPDAGLLRERAQLLKAEIARHPRQAARLLFSLGDIERLRAVAASDSDLETQDAGVSETVLIADMEDRLSATQIYLLNTPGGSIRAYQDAADAPPARCGDQVQVSGFRLGEIMLVTEAAIQQAGEPQPNCTPAGEHRVAVLYLKMPGMPDPPATMQDARTQFFSNDVASNNTFYKEGSYGQVSITGDVFGPFTMDRAYSCNETDLVLANAVRAAAPTVDFSQFSHVQMLMPPLPGGCGWAGIGTIGCSTVTVPNQPNARIAVVWEAVSRTYILRESTHEMGHNFGLGHSRSLDFPGEPLGPDRTRVIYTEYGDLFSAMGANDAFHFAAPHKAMLKWINEGAGFTTVTADGEFDILPAESQDPGVKALRVRRDLGQPNEFVWVEYRQPLGLFDSKLTPTAWGGAMLHYQSAATGLYAEALDLSPRPPGSAAGSFNDVVLAPGRVWQDTYSPLTIEVVSATSTALKVRIRYAPPCAKVAWPAGTQLDPAGGVLMPSVAAAPDCSFSQSGNDSWLAVRGDGGFDVMPNTTAFIRNGSATVARQTRFVAQLPVKTAPAIDFVSPSQGNLPSLDAVPFLIGVSTPNGTEMLRTVRVLFGSTSSPAAACYVQFDVPNRRLALYNDAGTSLSATLGVGASGSQQNTQCAVSAVSLTFPSRTYAQIGFAVSAKLAFSGDKQIFAAADHATDTAPAALESRGTLAVGGGCPAWFSPPLIYASGSGGTYSILQGSVCAWKLDGAPGWTTLASSSGSGPLRFNLTIKANDTTAERTVTLQTGSLGLTIRQAAAGMPAHSAVSFDNSEVRLARASGSGILYFQSNLPATLLTPVSSAPWLNVEPVTLDPILGPTLRYSFTGNLDTQARLAQVVVAGVPLGFTQDAGADPPGSGYLIGTIAGSGDIGDGAAARNAFLGSPAALALDSADNLYVAEQDFFRVRKVAPDGSISTVAGLGFSGFSGDGTAAVTARFAAVRGIAIDSKGNLFLSEGSRVRKITPDGTLSTLASGFSNAVGLAVDSNDRVYAADAGSHRVRRINTDGTLTTVAGTGARNYTGDGGAATSATLNGPSALAFDASGSLYIADAGNFAIRKVTGGNIQTIAGTGRSGLTRDGTAANGSPIGAPGALWADAGDNLYVTENARVRRIDSAGMLSTLAGGGSTRTAEGGNPLQAALAGTPQGLALTASGQVIFADTGSHVVRALGGGGTLATIAGSETWGPVGDGGAATGARLFYPQNAAAAPDGSIYFTEFRYHRVRRITPDGQIDTIAGDGTPGFTGDSGPAKAARLNSPNGIVVDPAGNVFVSDYNNVRIRKIATDGRISTYAGNGRVAFADGPALSASFNGVQGMAFDPLGNLYLADLFNHRVRVIKTDGTVATVAGNGKAAYSGDGGPATEASLQFPSGVGITAAGEVIVADTSNRRIRRVSADGTISTIAGNGLTSGDSYLAANAALGVIQGIAVMPSGDILIADSANSRIQKIGADGSLTTIAGGAANGFDGDGGAAWNALLNAPFAVTLDASGNLIVVDSRNNRLRLMQVQ